jgi:ankyrin repeat protein
VGLSCDKSAGANVNAANNNGETPLHKAIFNNSVKILMVNLLIKGEVLESLGSILLQLVLM